MRLQLVPPPPPPLSWSQAQVQRMAHALKDQARHMRRRWYAYAPVLAIWMLAYARLFIDPTPRLPLVFNWTPSLPYRLGWVRPAPPVLQRGDFVLFAFSGDAQAYYPGLRGQPFFKRIRGLPGDTITVTNRVVSINGQAVGSAKVRTYDRRALTPIGAMVIPPQHYYVQGSSPDSFDSRYRESGLVRAEQVIGIVTPLF